MGTYEYVLGPLPAPGQQRRLWIQHAAGFILLEDVRNYAVENLDPSLDAAARTAALKAIDDTVYGLMMVIDGVTGGLGNAEYLVHLETKVCLDARESNKPVESLALRDGDGMCMGFHMWRDGDFGKDPILAAEGRRPQWWPAQA